MAPQLSEATKGKIIGMWEAGRSYRFLAQYFQLSLSTVSLWINRFRKTNSINRLRGSGRNKILLDTEAREVVAMATVEPFMPSNKIRDNLQLQVSSRTIRNTLKEAGLRSRVAAKKPMLTENQRLQRLQFAPNYINWGINEWSLVLFTDESCIQSVSSSSVRVYQNLGFRFQPRYIRNVKRSGRVTVSVWGCMSAQGIGSLERIRGHLDGKSYCDILEHVMILDVLENHFPDGLFLLQQDNSPIHRSDAVKTWCEENFIMRLEWPSNAADLNPIENVWALWKDEVRLEGINTADELWRAASDAWQHIQSDRDIVTSLIESMPRRLQEVIDNDGGYTSY